MSFGGISTAENFHSENQITTAKNYYSENGTNESADNGQGASLALRLIARHHTSL